MRQRIVGLGQAPLGDRLNQFGVAARQLGEFRT